MFSIVLFQFCQVWRNTAFQKCKTPKKKKKKKKIQKLKSPSLNPVLHGIHSDDPKRADPELIAEIG